MYNRLNGALIGSAAAALLGGVFAVAPAFAQGPTPPPPPPSISSMPGAPGHFHANPHDSKYQQYLEGRQHADWHSKRMDIRHYDQRMQDREIGDRDQYHDEKRALQAQEKSYVAAHGGVLTESERRSVEQQMAKDHTEMMNDRHRAAYDAARNRYDAEGRYNEQKQVIKYDDKHHHNY